MAGVIQWTGHEQPGEGAEDRGLNLSGQRLTAQKIGIPQRQNTFVQRRGLHLQPRQHLMPDVGTLDEGVLIGERELPECDRNAGGDHQQCNHVGGSLSDMCSTVPASDQRTRHGS